MLLRPRQKLFVGRSLRALAEHGNTLGVAPSARLRLVRPSAGQDAATSCLVLLHALPGLLDALGAEVARRG
jgi:hypothetical protein